jgi:uncharacterized membrane protein YtjA (UPF0391 family)
VAPGWISRSGQAGPLVARCGVLAGRIRKKSMLKWAIIFFIISVIAGLFGFTNIAAGARGIAKVLFFLFFVVFLIVLIFGVFLGVLVF